MPDRDVGPIVANAALTRLGAPYAWAAAGPDAFDCSGLVVWAFHQAGLTLPRSSQALAAGGQPVSLDQMQPGDVISLFPDASHVGIYVGDGRMVRPVRRPAGDRRAPGSAHRSTTSVAIDNHHSTNQRRPPMMASRLTYLLDSHVMLWVLIEQGARGQGSAARLGAVTPT